MKYILKRYYPVLIFVFVLFVYLSPFLLLRQDSNVYLHDTLEERVVYFKTLKESGKIFAPYNEPMPEALQDDIRASYPSSLNIITWLYFVFSPFQAYVLNQIIIRALAFVGMYLLLKTHFNQNKHAKLANTIVAILFSLIPFWPLGGLSIAGQPLLLFSLLNFQKEKQNKIDFLILILIAFYSYFERSHIFLVFLLGLWWIFEIIRSRKINWNFALGLFFFCFVSLVAQHQLVIQMFMDRSYLTHRVEFDKLSLWGVDKYGVLQKATHNFLWGQEHVQDLHFLIFPISLIALVLTFFKKQKLNFKLLSLLILNLLISIFYGLWYWKGFNIVLRFFPLFNSLNISRFHWLHPMFWYIILGISLFSLYKILDKKIFIAFITLFLVFQTNSIYKNHEHIKGRVANEPTYKQFYSEELFKDIDTYIASDKTSFYTISIGIHPAIPRYNGFYTLDGYSGNYPLEFKHKFRSIIQKELEKNEENRIYFDNFGNRCYILTAELDKEFKATKDKNQKLENLELNTDVLKEFNVKYVFSAVEILNFEENDMQFEKTFETDDSVWKIYLYKIV